MWRVARNHAPPFGRGATSFCRGEYQDHLSFSSSAGVTTVKTPVCPGSQTSIFRPRQRKLSLVVFVTALKQNTNCRSFADRLSIAGVHRCSRPVRPFGVQQRGLKKAAERPSAGSQKTAGRSSAGSVTAAAVRKDKERKVKIEAWSALTVALPHM
jgi:hypothetical protein